MRKVTGNRLQVTVVLAILILLLPVASYLSPVYADVKIGDKFGFGGFTSLGQATSLLVGPVFDVAGFLLVLYFLLGAFRFLKAGGNKEDMESARQMINHAIVGFFLLMFAFLIIQFIPQFFKLQGLDIIK